MSQNRLENLTRLTKRINTTNARILPHFERKRNEVSAVFAQVVCGYDGGMSSALRNLKFFRWSAVVFVLGILLVLGLRGPEQALLAAVLAILEISLSFDNAVINATILRRMSAFWQRMFLTVGMVVAVAGMRLLFPIALVSITTGLSFGGVIDLVLHNPAEYGVRLQSAHSVIAAFGGMILFMIFLDFLIDRGKQVHWLAVIERPLARAGHLKLLSAAIALAALLVVAATWAGPDAPRVLVAGVLGQVVYGVVRGLSLWFERLEGVTPAGSPKRAMGATVLATGRRALFMFIYLEMLDASFSFDGVVGAFAISDNVLTIAVGLGIGALFVRELTVWLVRRDALKAFVYLEHGAHYAVGVLAILLAASLAYEVPEAVTGLAGVACIGLALLSSVIAKRQPKTAS
jgi:hypothetical protein